MKMLGEISKQISTLQEDLNHDFAQLEQEDQLDECSEELSPDL
jgi:hypothetical protein